MSAIHTETCIIPGQLDGQKILILATHGFEQSKLEMPCDKLKAAGAQVEVVAWGRAKYKAGI